MTKLQFLMKLHERLSDLPQRDVEERLNFYCEMIEDRMEEGRAEEEAVADVGSIEEIAAQIRNELCALTPEQPPSKGKKQTHIWTAVLLILGAVVWLPLLISAVAVGISVYAVAWVCVITLWIVFGVMAGCAVGCAVTGGVLAICGQLYAGIALLGIGLTFGGLGIFTFFGSKGAGRGLVRLTKWIALKIKSSFTKEGSACENP